MMMKIGDRVCAEGHNGTLVEPDDELRAKRPVLVSRPSEYWCVRFDGPGPHGDGIGVYHCMSLLLRRIVRS